MTGELFHITGIHTAENNLDEYNYAHLICECTLADEAIRVPRPIDKTGWVYCTCPRCGKELGIFAKSKRLLDAEKDYGEQDD